MNLRAFVDQRASQSRQYDKAVKHKDLHAFKYIGVHVPMSPIHVQRNVSKSNYPCHILPLFTFYFLSKWHFTDRKIWTLKFFGH